MAFETKEFIIDLVRQLNLNNMDDATRARLKDLKDKGVATKEQMSWDPGKEPPKIDKKKPADPTTTPPTPETYLYNGNPTAGGAAPTSNDLTDLYKKLVIIMRDLTADDELKAEAPVKSFLDSFYGAGKIIQPFSILPLTGTIAQDIGRYITSNLADFTSFFDDNIKEKDLTSLATKLNDGSYVSDAKSLNNLDKFLKKIAHYYQWDNSRPLPSRDLPASLGSATGSATNLDISFIDSIRKHIKQPTVPTTLDTFKDGLPVLFNKLITNDKLLEKFSEKDTDGDISKWISKGKSKSNYKDGDNALTPKYTDRKQFWDDAKAKINDWYVDTLGKLEQKHKRHIYQTNARYIVDELIKKGVKPTDGTGKILETLDSINGNLPNPVQKQMKWVKETLAKMSKTKFFNDALRDGDQMRQLVQEIIKAAAHDDKIEEAKVALEMLSVMRYTITTSSVRDQLRKTEFKVFSDSGLSFNKGNNFMQGFTNVVDKALKGAMMAAFEVGNLAKNALKQSGVKFGHGKDRLDKRTTDSVEYKDSDKKAKMEELFAFWDFVNSSANTKDYNIFRRHKNVQKNQDKPGHTGTYSVTTLGGVTYDKDNPTKQQKLFMDYLKNNNIGRAT